jgi:hypothetical protein
MAKILKLPKADKSGGYYFYEDFQWRTNWFLLGALTLNFVVWAAAIWFVLWLISPANAQHRLPGDPAIAIRKGCDARFDPRVSGPQRERGIAKCTAEELVRRHHANRVEFPQ